MKKRVVTAFMTASMILSLAGCGSGSQETTASTVGTETETAESVSETQITETETASETAFETTAETESSNRGKMVEAYQAALENIYQNLILPDGTELKTGENYDLSANQFAVYDVDHDGRDELIFKFIETYMAAMTAKIYDYDEVHDCLKEELSEFPTLCFYDNATITADISHNQGYAGEFWPYTFYRYDAESDVYRAEYFVDAWDKSLSDVSYEGEAFPDDADTDGDGIVYYLDEPGSSTHSDPMDKDAYDAWYAENIGCANEEDIPFEDLTQDNIDNIQ